MSTSNIRVLIVGAHGKMGKPAMAAIQNHPALTLVGGCDRDSNLADMIRNTRPDVAVDLTNPTVVYQHAELFIEHEIHPVIGTSGLSEQQIQTLSAACNQKQLGGLIVPNFSIGAVLMMHFAARASAYYANAHIVETHHLEKKDAPSGTAIHTAHLMHSAQKTKPLPHASVETQPGSLGAVVQGIPIHSVRLPGKLAHQTVTLASTGETLTIQHDTHNRAAFMPGLCLCCEQVNQLNSLQMGLEKILFSET